MRSRQPAGLNDRCKEESGEVSWTRQSHEEIAGAVELSPAPARFRPAY